MSCDCCPRFPSRSPEDGIEPRRGAGLAQGARLVQYDDKAAGRSETMSREGATTTLGPIRKPEAVRAAANLQADPSASDLGWEIYRQWLDGLPDGGLNIAYEAVDRHVANGRGAKEALRWIGRDGRRRSFTYADLKAETDRFARLLRDRGHRKGVRVFSLLGRVPELYFAALGTLKAGGVFCPLYSAFGPEPVRARMTIGEAEVLVTTAADYEKKVRSWREELPSLGTVLLVDDAGTGPDTTGLAAALQAAAADFGPIESRPEDLALLHFTSGTTGKPKGAMHVHEAVVAHHATGRLVLDLKPDDVFWCTADPGWVTGTSYGIIAPLTNGVTMVVDEGEFDAERWYATLEREQVTVWYTAPTAIRLLVKAGADLARRRGRVEPGNLRKAVPRQLVADRNRRHHDRQLRRDGRQAGLDGQADSGSRSGDRRARGRPRAAGRRTSGEGRACAAPGLAVDVSRLPQRGNALRRLLILPATSPCAMRTGTSGSSAARTT